MSKVPYMEEPLVNILELGRWMTENQISRATLASAIGMNRSAIDNYFVRKKLPRHAQILIKRFMDGQEAVFASNEITSLITIPLSNRVINLAMKAAVEKTSRWKSLWGGLLKGRQRKLWREAGVIRKKGGLISMSAVKLLD